MSWIPPPIATGRLMLLSEGGPYDPVFSWDRLGAELPGLPSNWRIFLMEAPEPIPIGSIGFIHWDKEQGLGEIGFILMKDYTGRGYMTDACRGILRFGFHGMGLKTIEAKSFPNNVASIRVLEKIGMTKVARVQTRLSSGGPLVDLDRYIIQKISAPPPR